MRNIEPVHLRLRTMNWGVLAAERRSLWSREMFFVVANWTTIQNHPSAPFLLQQLASPPHTIQEGRSVLGCVYMEG